MASEKPTNGTWPGASPADLEKLLQTSGFPFQERIRHLVQSSRAQHDWEVLAEEFRWLDPTKAIDHYADLVLERDPFRAVLECKRTGGGALLFLPHAHPQRPVPFLTEKRQGRSLGYEAHSLPAWIPRAGACLVAGDDKSSNGLLERLGSELTLAAEAIAEEELTTDGIPETWITYLSLIVTNRPLFSYPLAAGAVNLVTGQLDTIDPSKFESVPWVCFQKALQSREVYWPTGSRQRFGSAVLERDTLRQRSILQERALWVVQAQHLVEFLATWPRA